MDIRHVLFTGFLLLIMDQARLVGAPMIYAVSPAEYAYIFQKVAVSNEKTIPEQQIRELDVNVISTLLSRFHPDDHIWLCGIFVEILFISVFICCCLCSKCRKPKTQQPLLPSVSAGMKEPPYNLYYMGGQGHVNNAFHPLVNTYMPNQRV